jgi:hypothetical protein
VRWNSNRLVIQWRWLWLWWPYRPRALLNSLSYREQPSLGSFLRKRSQRVQWRNWRNHPTNSSLLSVMPEQINVKDSHNELIFPHSVCHKSRGEVFFFAKSLNIVESDGVVLIDADVYVWKIKKKKKAEKSNADSKRTLKSRICLGFYSTQAIALACWFGCRALAFVVKFTRIGGWLRVEEFLMELGIATYCR